MKLQKISIEEIRNHKANSYNPSIWNKKIDGLLEFKKLQFYIWKKEESKYDYDRFYASYIIPEGIHLMKEFGFSSSLTNANFNMVKIADSGEIELVHIGMPNNYEGREICSKLSKEQGIIWTNCL